MDIRCKIDTSPIYADGKLKGSLQLIHQDTEIMKLQNELNHTRSLVRALESQIYFVDIIGTSQLMSMSIQQGKLAAQADHAVFLRGEEGTGKDMFASAIHNESKQRYHQFKVINCLNTNKEELEAFFNEGRGRKDSELTGQNELRGTLYLDEISYLPLDLQKQLHKCLLNTQQRTDSASPFLGMRIIASSSINVEKAMMNGEFLEELYYDLIKGSIYLPSLKEHKEDILPIATTFIDQLNQRYGRKVKKMSEEALQNLGNYSFPGNVRELKAMIEVAMVRMTKKDELLVAEHFCFAQTSLIKKAKMDIPEVQQDQPLSLLVEGYEKIIIEQTLTKLEGNKTLTAKKLGLSVRNLYYKLEKYHLN
jgi:transcriptional regulator with PAS, ATPase and Fis domain